MITKAFEIRDKATFIPVIATLMVPDYSQPEGEAYLIGRAGFRPSTPCVILCRMMASGVDRNATYDTFSWGPGSRTMSVAHTYIEQHFNEMVSGDVVDVEFILGETDKPKVSERVG